MTKFSLTRRHFLAGILGAGAVAAIGVSRDTTYDVQYQSITFSSRYLPEAFNGYRVAFLTDLHAGPFIPLEWLKEVIDEVMRFKPQLLMLGGDLVDAPKSFLSKSLGKISGKEYSGKNSLPYGEYYYSSLSDLIFESAPADGIVMVPGNHDRWFSPQIWRKIPQNAGIKVLVNETHDIIKNGSRLSIYGADDFTSGFPELFPAVDTSSGKEAAILLTHSPDYLYLLEHSEAPSLNGYVAGLFGHTHGGQIVIPAYGALTYNVRKTRHASGFSRIGETDFYTSRGLGVVEIPVRINCRPEATLIELKTSAI